MIANLLIRFQNWPFNPRGKQRLMIVVDQCFGPFSARTPDGLLMRVFPSSSMDVSYFRKDSSDSDHPIDPKALVNELEHGDVFVDVGANIGYLSLLASRRVGESGRVFAFEPSHREFSRLLANIQINKADNLIVYSLAIGENPGFLALEIEEHHTGLNHLVGISEERSGGHRSRRQLTGVLRLDDALPHHDLTAIQLMKIDVEGAEMRVLQGMPELLGSRKIKRLCIEITPDFLVRFGDSRESLFSYLGSFGYRPRDDLNVRQYDEVFEIA